MSDERDRDTETDAIIDVATKAAGLHEIDPTKIYGAYGPSGQLGVLEMGGLLPTPRRKAGVIQLYDADSLVSFFNTQGAGSQTTTTLYADQETYSLVAVFNDAKLEPGWRDHRALLKTRPTREWKHWLGKDGALRSQVDFAEHIEQGLLEIQTPSAADVLELAQTFEANQKVAFKQATMLADGARQLLYEQTIEAKAGQRGQLTIPKEFILALRPFEGSAHVVIAARLRYRIAEERLHIGYTLNRPQDAADEAFADIVAAVEKGTGVAALKGAPEVPK